MFFFRILERLHSLEQWRHHMDAQVTQLTANIAALQTDVAGILAELVTLQGELAAGIAADDEAAITAANVALVDINARLAAALPPAVVTGTTGATTG